MPRRKRSWPMPPSGRRSRRHDSIGGRIEGRAMDLRLGGLRRPGAFIRGDAIQRFLAFGALILIVVFFSIASPEFRSFDNFTGILIATAVVGVLALGETFVMITAGIDLSIGTTMTLAAVMTGV